MPVKSLEELTNTDYPAIDLIRQWTTSAQNHVEILSPSANREAVLLDVQVTTHSTMGAVAYETGGVLVDDGWLRFLGSGHPCRFTKPSTVNAIFCVNCRRERINRGSHKA
jgi:hypothetical protein